MKRFDFALEKVRQWRYEQAEVEQQKLHKLYADLQVLEETRLGIENERDAAIVAIRDSPTSGASDRANLDTYREYIRQKLFRNGQQKRDCQGQVEKQRQALLEVRRSFELLERLKQKAWAEWTAARDKEQEELAAELYLAKRRRGIQTSEIR